MQVTLRVDRPGDAAPRGAPLGRIAGQRLGRDTALACDLKAPLEQRLGILEHAVQRLVARVHPQLAPGRLDDRRTLPAVV